MHRNTPTPPYEKIPPAIKFGAHVLQNEVNRGGQRVTHQLANTTETFLSENHLPIDHRRIGVCVVLTLKTIFLPNDMIIISTPRVRADSSS